ncbi:MAG: cysteine desulfurase family protein [Gemmatimonadota bacterium]|nr:cysteine desulfurase family protein [Gemmatimonadota bacterium]
MSEQGPPRIYLDHNATTPVAPEVLDAMLPFLGAGFGNSSSIHAEGRVAHEALDRARSQVARLLAVDQAEIYFTSGGTESNNLAIRGVAEHALASGGGSHLITSSVEHNAVLQPVQHLGSSGMEITLLAVDSTGLVDPDDLRADIRPGQTCLVSIIAANNEVGTIEPFEALGEICRSAGVLFHIDAVQTAGKVPLEAGSLPVDLLSLSGHKLYGPKGAGALYVRRGVEIQPQLLGGTHERGLRAGTVNVPAIVGLGAACDLARREGNQQILRLKALRDRLYQGLCEKIEGVRLNGHPELRLCNTLNVSFEGVEGEVLLLRLDLEGIAVSAGSACASGSLEPSHVLTAMGVSPELAGSSLRLSLGRGNSEHEIDRVVEVLRESVARLRSM